MNKRRLYIARSMSIWRNVHMSSKARDIFAEDARPMPTSIARARDGARQRRHARCARPRDADCCCAGACACTITFEKKSSMPPRDCQLHARTRRCQEKTSRARAARFFGRCISIFVPATRHVLMLRSVGARHCRITFWRSRDGTRDFTRVAIFASYIVPRPHCLQRESA